MGCASCGSSGGSNPSGCGNKGHCSSGGCNRRNTYDWLSDQELNDPTGYQFAEVSFKNGATKEFYHLDPEKQLVTGDMVVVESTSGHDVGLITLSGELVRLQMKKRKITEDRVSLKILRKANQRDLDRLKEARDLEKSTMVRARVIARTLGLNMKLGDVQYQGDKRKATFYYTAEGRVDFRELVRSYAKEFRIKIEMRQIGARQESARIGGIGACGRELCCSTWLSDFKSVTTTAARYQNIAINQVKLSGQCGRLKCCLNYELDTYMEALSHFPKHADNLRTEAGKAILIKTDIFKGIMYYTIQLERGRGPVIALDKERVKEILAMNKRGEKPVDLRSVQIMPEIDEDDVELEFADVTGEIELPSIKKRRRPNKNKKRRPQDKRRSKSGDRPKTENRGQAKNKQASTSKDKNERPKKDDGRPPKTSNQPKRQPKSNSDGPSWDDRPARKPNKPRNHRNKKSNNNDNKAKNDGQKPSE